MRLPQQVRASSGLAPVTAGGAREETRRLAALLADPEMRLPHLAAELARTAAPDPENPDAGLEATLEVQCYISDQL